MLLVLADQSRSVLAAQVVVSGHPQVLGGQDADVALVHGHSVSQRVQVGLELGDHLLRKVRAVGADLLQVVLLFGAGEVEGGQGVEQRVDFTEERFGDVGNPAQGVDELLFALDLVELDGLLVHGLVPSELDGLQVQVVAVLGHLVHLHLHLHGRLGEVGLDQLHLGFEGFHLQATVGTNTEGRRERVHNRSDLRGTVHSARQPLHVTLFQFPLGVVQEDVGHVGELPELRQVELVARLLHGGDVEEVREVPPLLPQVHRLQGELAEAPLQVLDPTHRRRVLLLPVDEEEHEADDDERLDQGREEEHDPHVVTAAFAPTRAVRHPLLRLGAVLGHAGVHGRSSGVLQSE